MKKLLIEIEDDNLYEKLKFKALEEKRTLKEIVTELLKKYLNKGE